jgi:hypothetical protein
VCNADASSIQTLLTLQETATPGELPQEHAQQRRQERRVQVLYVHHQQKESHPMTWLIVLGLVLALVLLASTDPNWPGSSGATSASVR